MITRKDKRQAKKNAIKKNQKLKKLETAAANFSTLQQFLAFHRSCSHPSSSQQQTVEPRDQLHSYNRERSNFLRTRVEVETRRKWKEEKKNSGTRELQSLKKRQTEQIDVNFSRRFFCWDSIDFPVVEVREKCVHWDFIFGFYDWRMKKSLNSREQLRRFFRPNFSQVCVKIHPIDPRKKLLNK